MKRKNKNVNKVVVFFVFVKKKKRKSLKTNFIENLENFYKKSLSSFCNKIILCDLRIHTNKHTRFLNMGFLLN
jgi:REP element-mobilizing transposase RayT